MQKIRLSKLSTKRKQEIAKWAGRSSWESHGGWGNGYEIHLRWAQLWTWEQLRHKHPEQFLKAIKAVEVDHSERGNTLLRSRFMGSFGSVTHWLRYNDSTTGEVYVSGVPYGEKVKADGRPLRPWESEYEEAWVDRGGNRIDLVRLAMLNQFAPRPSEWTVRRKRRPLWDCTTADGCMAWKFGLTLAEYLGIEAEA